jgi:hypothetical protein
LLTVKQALERPIPWEGYKTFCCTIFLSKRPTRTLNLLQAQRPRILDKTKKFYAKPLKIIQIPRIILGTPKGRICLI